MRQVKQSKWPEHKKDRAEKTTIRKSKGKGAEWSFRGDFSLCLESFEKEGATMGSVTGKTGAAIEQAFLAHEGGRELDPPKRRAIRSRAPENAGSIVEIRDLRDEDMMRLAKRLRRMDRLEVTSMAPGQPLDDVLLASGRASLRGRAGFWNGELVACWGIAARTESEGAPWLLATDALDHKEVRRAFVRHGAEEMNRLTDGFRYLWNLVHRENGLARRWLRFMGFEFRDPKEYVISDEPFVRFEMETT
jgi:hypothetical protein